MPDRRTFLAASAAALVLPAALRAASPEVFQTGGLALGGTDPVAYFTEGAPVPGASQHALSWRGATWQFASAANRARFEMDPDAFAPRYGGYCAFAMASGYIADSVPEAWSVVDGALYLNLSLSVRERWLADPAGFIARADANWPAALG